MDAATAHTARDFAQKRPRLAPTFTGFDVHDILGYLKDVRKKTDHIRAKKNNIRNEIRFKTPEMYWKEHDLAKQGHHQKNSPFLYTAPIKKK